MARTQPKVTSIRSSRAKHPRHTTLIALPANLCSAGTPQHLDSDLFMNNTQNFYINGTWVKPQGADTFDVINPATESAVATIAMGNAQDVDNAVAAARAAFDSWSETTPEARAQLMDKLIAIYQRRYEEIAQSMTQEMGAPISFSREGQTPVGDGHLQATVDALRAHTFERPSPRGGSMLCDEPVGVCALITPWNWPMNQVIVKVAPALAAGCTMVLKPSEYSPLSAILLAEMIDEAGFPDGVFNLVNGNGAQVGSAMTQHPDVDMVSFTGSTRAGIQITQAAANTVKRVALELGGKSPNVVFADADLQAAAVHTVNHICSNSGQDCDALSRLLVERSAYDQVVAYAVEAANAMKVDDPMKEGDHLGPVVNKNQYEQIQAAIQSGIDEGAQLVAGGLGRPEHLDKGYYIRPTIFAGVHNDMHIARNEIFGPVLVIIPFDDESEGLRLANDTPYGLGACVFSGDSDKAQRVARKLRAGVVSINGGAYDYDVPFGGYKQSGNGRENGVYGLHDYLDVKAITTA